MTRFCLGCGTPMTAVATRCPQCGQPTGSSQPYSKTTTANFSATPSYRQPESAAPQREAWIGGICAGLVLLMTGGFFWLRIRTTAPVLTASTEAATSSVLTAPSATVSFKNTPATLITPTVTTFPPSAAPRNPMQFADTSGRIDNVVVKQIVDYLITYSDAVKAQKDLSRNAVVALHQIRRTHSEDALQAVQDLLGDYSVRSQAVMNTLGRYPCPQQCLNLRELLQRSTDVEAAELRNLADGLQYLLEHKNSATQEAYDAWSAHLDVLDQQADETIDACNAEAERVRTSDPRIAAQIGPARHPE